MGWPLQLSLLLALQGVAAHFDATTCGSAKQCVYVPPGCEKNNVCKHIFSYVSTTDDFVDMELYTTDYTAGANYIAVGFSKDDMMGDDPVTQCVFPAAGKPEVHVSYNFGKSNQPPQDADDKEAEKTHVELLHAHKDENSLYCQFRQKIAPGPSNFFPSLDQSSILFIARGKARKPTLLGLHSTDPASPDFPFISADRHNVARRKATPGKTAESPTVSHVEEASWFNGAVRHWFVKCHGILMIVAWLVLVPLAVFAARYFRDHWAGSAPHGLKWWFHLHRTFNFIAVLLIIPAVILIFAAEGWSWTGPAIGLPEEQNSGPGAIHSMSGTIAVLIAFLNPMMALCRCAPDTGARPLFNWSHRILGITGFLAALVAIFIATNWFHLWYSQIWAFTVFLLFLILIFVSILLFEVLDWMKTRTQQKVHHMEMRGRGHYDNNGRIVTSTKILHERPMRATTALYVLFGLISGTIAAALIVFTVLGP